MGIVRRFRVWGAVGLLVVAAMTAHAQTPRPEADAEFAGLLQAALTDAYSTIPNLSSTERAQLWDVYVSGGWAPLWVTSDRRPHADARVALLLLDGASGDGLDPRDYRAALLHEMAAALDRVPIPAAADVAAFDAGMSAGVALFFRDLHAGRVDPRTIGFRMTVGRDEHNFPALVHSALRAHRLAETASELVPQFAVYRGLRTALTTYRELAAGWPFDLPPLPNKALHLGEPYRGLRELRRQLEALGDWPNDPSVPATSSVYDGAFAEAVMRFQVRHGLDTDGVLGRETMEALRVPLAWRVRQIELGLERLRWLPHLGKGRFLAVNIPMFRLWAWDAAMPDAMPFSSRVIVGRALDRETPVFVDEMRHIIFRPYWNVPPGILRREILPALVRDPRYFERQNMEIVDGAGDDARPVDVTAQSVAQLRHGQLRVRQRPGPANALGLVKFVFPNEENVYLHATPAPQLFARSRRDFSHGCVRVEDAVALAEWVLAARGGWTREGILAAMNGTEPMRVDLEQPIQVILFYITAAIMPEDGSVHFARDIYGHDATLDRALVRSGRNR